MTSVWALIVAAGSGKRFSNDGNGLLKQHQHLLGNTVLATAVGAFLRIDSIAGVMVVLAPNDHTRLAVDPRIHYCAGGNERYLSVLLGLQALQSKASPQDLILVHDAARPCVTTRDIQQLISQWQTLGEMDDVAVCLGTPCVDNLHLVDASFDVVGTPGRQSLWRAFTPQAANLRTLLKSMRGGLKSLSSGMNFKDESGVNCKDESSVNFKDEVEAVIQMGGRVVMVPGSADNIKITHSEDLAAAQQILRPATGPDLRIGHGYDVHAFKPGDHIVLGGVMIVHDQAILAHSDGDVLLHAVCDAVLGALALGDIGVHFPDTEAAFKAINSRLLLAKVISWMKERGWCLQNLDITVIAQRPKIRPYVAQMQNNLAEDFAVDVERVNIKATTTERLGFIGRAEGIAAEAVVLLTRNN